jgi:rhodanese-related sulfurtransferase
MEERAMTHKPNAISIDELREMMALSPGTPLLDVRTPDEFEEAHVPGARNFPLGSLDAAGLIADGTVSRGGPIYLICHTQNRSKIAAERFLAAGHSQTYFISGGTAAWMAASLPVARGNSNAAEQPEVSDGAKPCVA